MATGLARREVSLISSSIGISRVPTCLQYTWAAHITAYESMSQQRSHSDCSTLHSSSRKNQAVNRRTSEGHAHERRDRHSTPRSSNTPDSPTHTNSSNARSDLNKSRLDHGVTRNHRRLLQHARGEPERHPRADHKVLSTTGVRSPPAQWWIHPGVRTGT
jgi:hypothetical protein